MDGGRDHQEGRCRKLSTFQPMKTHGRAQGHGRAFLGHDAPKGTRAFTYIGNALVHALCPTKKGMPSGGPFIPWNGEGLHGFGEDVPCHSTDHHKIDEPRSREGKPQPSPTKAAPHVILPSQKIRRTIRRTITSPTAGNLTASPCRRSLCRLRQMASCAGHSRRATLHPPRRPNGPPWRS